MCVCVCEGEGKTYIFQPIKYSILMHYYIVNISDYDQTAQKQRMILVFMFATCCQMFFSLHQSNMSFI